LLVMMFHGEKALFVKVVVA